MKLIKKIAAIMLSVMMVLGMASVVSASEGTTTSGTSTANTGKITINKAIPGQTYTIYKLLDLESYDATNNLYSYKPAAEWETFFKTEGQGKAYVDINKNGYVTWKTGETDDKAAELAQKALAYAKVETNSIRTKTEVTASETTVAFANLSLGYYLVDSSLGALCSLNTTNPTVIIEEKNGEPTVEKKVSSEENGTYESSNFANIGDKVYFQTTITAQSGAQNYVLHDKMDAGLTFDINSVKVNLKENNVTTGRVVDASSYEVKNSRLESENPCTFHVEFKKEFCDTLAADDKIIVTYSATLNEKAFIGMKTDESGNANGNINTTHISYGENNTESTPSKTDTYTLEIPVFKYTNTKTGKTALAGAKFALYETETKGTAIKLVKKNETAEKYRKALETETAITEITTTDTGSFSIQGLKPGTYWLEETAAPKGYNKLAKRIKVEITKYSTLYVDDKKTIKSQPITNVEVENNTGTILPSTGGNGTSLIYFLGAVLALGSSVVLITKKRMR